MSIRTAAAASMLLMMATSAAAQTLPERAVRRDIPITNSIRRAFAAGTRDSTGAPGRNYWQTKTDYTIEARLDPATATISGRGRIVLHNNSPDSLPTIVLRLNPNIFRGTSPRGSSVPAENTEGIIISRMTLNGVAVNLAPPPRQFGPQGPQRPTEPQAFGLNTTMAQVVLPSAIRARSDATIDIEWSMKLPGGPGGSGHRMTMRWADTLFQPTQWFPRVAMYDDLRGWDTEVYLGPAEFFNPFGRYDVKLDVPGGWIVTGTGLLQNAEQVLKPEVRARLARVTQVDTITISAAGERATLPGERHVWHFVADSVNDFAWATAKDFVWKGARANIPTRGFVPIYMVHLPGRANLFANAAANTRHALEFYSQLWFPYPFPQLTLQDGPSAGMEYPMVINSNQGAADHETAHQWWPMVVGTDETRYGWMDEGFNQYMNVLSGADSRGISPPPLNGAGQAYGRTSGNEAEPPLMWNANYGGPMYGFQTYQKTPLMLSMLGGIVGDTAVWNAHRAWANAWKWKHPSPWDYMFFMNRALGRDLGWFWYYWLFTTESSDGSIERATTSTNGITEVVVRQDGQMPAPIVLRVEFAAEGAAIRPMQNSRMLDATTALVTVPVDVWFAGARTHTVRLDFGGRAIQKITLDPFGRFPDRDASDNVWPRS